MAEKEIKKVESESFKDKILRQLEEANRTLDEVSSKADLSTPETENAHPIISATNQEQVPSLDDTGLFENVPDAIIEKTPRRAKLSHQFPQDKGAFEASDLPKRSSKEPPVVSEENADFENPIEDTQKIQNMKRATRQAQESDLRSVKQQSKTLANKIIAVVVLVLLLVGSTTAFFAYCYIKSEIQPYDLNDKTTKVVNIPEGVATKEIGQILEKKHIIKNATGFQYYTKLKSLTGFKSGYYNLSPSMTLKEIAKILQEGGTETPVTPILGKIMIPEGFTIEQIADRISQNAESKSTKDKTPFTREAFLKLVTDDAFIAKMTATYPELFATLPAKDSGVIYQLEGYLFPATYEYTKKSTLTSVVEQMIATMNQNLQPYYDKIREKNMTVNEVLAIAALTEKEANNDADRRHVAQVFYNRMNLGMTLSSNVSILYAEGKLGQKTTLAEDVAVDTMLDSPFNLYLYLGCGPGPVTNPSLSAIKAAVEPTDNNDLYFVADVTTGKVYFSETAEEHEINVQKYVNDKLATDATTDFSESQ